MGVTANPRTYAQLLAASGLVGPDPFGILICGQIGAAGTATSEMNYTNVQSMTNSEIEILFGDNSELTNRIMKARSIILGRAPISVIGLTAAAGSAATLDLVVGGTSATETKRMVIKLIDSDLYSVNVDVTIGDLAASVATAIKAAIDELTSLPATAAVVTNTVTLTAADVGTIPNKFTVKIDGVPAGLTVTDGQFSAGVTDPTTTTIFDNVSATRFHSISWPWESDFAAVKTFLEARNVINNDFLQGVAFIGFDDTEANIRLKVNDTSGTPENSQNLFFVGNRQIGGDSVIITPSDWRVVEFMSIEALRMTEGVAISPYVTVDNPGDQIGGPALASLGYYNTPLAITDIALADELFSGIAQVNLESDGFTIIGVNPSSTIMIMGQVVSTYKFNTLGNPDLSFKYLNYIRTGYLALEIIFKNLQASYSQFRLTEGDLVEGRAIANEESIQGKLLELYATLSGADFVLLQAGKIASKYFTDNLGISLDLATGAVTISGQLPIITQMRVIYITFQMSFSTGG